MESAAYRFRWSNYNLGRMLKERRNAAQRLRNDAEILVKRAEQIEAEASEWEDALVPLPAPPERG